MVPSVPTAFARAVLAERATRRSDRLGRLGLRLANPVEAVDEARERGPGAGRAMLEPQTVQHSDDAFPVMAQRIVGDDDAGLQGEPQSIDAPLQRGNLIAKFRDLISIRFLHHGVLVKDVVWIAAGRRESPGSTQPVRPDPGPSNVRISSYRDQS